MTLPNSRSWRTPGLILVCGSIVVVLTYGLRSSFGLFLKPMSIDLGWGREIFAFALALQNLLWGAFQPFVGAVADKWGSGRVVAAGSLIYALGLFIMSETASPFALHMSAGVLIALGLSGASLIVVLGAVGRAVDPEHRSWALGIVTAAGSVGQLTVVPISQAFLSNYGWPTAFRLLGICMLAMIPMAVALAGRTSLASDSGKETLGEALGEAKRHGGFWFLTAGFFVCGFHVAFIAVHLPAYLTALIGLFNIFGSVTSGVLGGKRSKKYLLSFLYSARAATFLAFILVPLSISTVLAFSAVIGVLWLSTVPLTSGLVAQIFGPRYMGMLFGIVFFSHQVGSFIGVWLGGYLFDATGSYLMVWWLSVALGLLATALHLPIDERAVHPITKPE
jgi:MFS family permease